MSKKIITLCTLLLFLSLESMANNDLVKCRKKIDKIDQKIIDLLAERYKIVHKVGEIKSLSAKNNGYLFMNMKREFDLLQKLINDSDLPSAIIYNIWRTIISGANKMEQKLVFITNSDDGEKNIIDTYRSFYDIRKITTDKVISELEKNPENKIAVLGLKDDHWWYDAFIKRKIHLNDVKIFSAMPWTTSPVKNSNYQVSIGKIAIENMGNEYILAVTGKEFDAIDKVTILDSYKDKKLVIIEAKKQSGLGIQDKDIVGRLIKPIVLGNNF